MFGKVYFDPPLAQVGLGKCENVQVSVLLPSPLLLRRPPLKLPNATIPYRTGTRCAADSRLVGKSARNAVPGQALSAGQPCHLCAALPGLRIRRTLLPPLPPLPPAVAVPSCLPPLPTRALYTQH